jgi:hypothetical protein
MHGVYLREYKKSFHKLFINNGHLMNLYRYPKIDAMFHSPMVNDHNLHLCGGWFFPGVKDSECITRVVQGLKPMGFFITFEKKVYEHWLEICNESGLPYTSKMSEKENRYEIGISVKGTFGEVFELSHLLHDHLSYINTASDINKEKLCSDVTSLIATLKNKTIAEYLDYEYANQSTPCAKILVGLMLGYPIESTASVLFFR